MLSINEDEWMCSTQARSVTFARPLDSNYEFWNEFYAVAGQMTSRRFDFFRHATSSRKVAFRIPKEHPAKFHSGYLYTDSILVGSIFKQLEMILVVVRCIGRTRVD